MAYSPEKLALIALNTVPEMGAAILEKLAAAFGSAGGSLGRSAVELAEAGMPPAAASRLAALGPDAAEKEAALAEKSGARVITILDAGYPRSLLGFADKPLVLYLKGDAGLLSKPSMAVVGTRNATSYGRYAASEFSKGFSRAGLSVVSGLARGIDTEAHSAALECGGGTVAVLGNGLNVCYPPENGKLQRRIAAEGALLSEFPMGRRADRLTFPRRNRIISGLALATLVVEADFKSGALITAKCALDQGKEVFAVPGPVYSKASNGPNYLIKNGACLADSPETVMEALEGLAWRDAAPETGDKNGILEVLRARRRAVSIDDIKEQSGLDPGELAKGLFDLEVKGLIRSLPGKFYTLN